MFAKIYAKALLLAALLTMATGACDQPAPDDADNTPSPTAQRLKQFVPPHPAWTAVEGNAAFDKDTRDGTKYKSDASFADVKSFYLERLIGDGWQFIADNEVKDRGRIRGERLLKFRRDGHELTIKYAGQRADDLGWDYAVDVAPSE